MAPYLFVVAVEILRILIRQNPSIRGISIGEGSVCISQFADDLTAFVPDHPSAQALLDSVGSFGLYSGLNIYRTKSQLLLLGPQPTKELDCEAS